MTTGGQIPTEKHYRSLVIQSYLESLSKLHFRSTKLALISTKCVSTNCAEEREGEPVQN